MTVVPAVLIVLLACFKVNVIVNMAVSIACAVFVCIFVQKMQVGDVLMSLLCGYDAGNDAVLAALINGGGAVSYTHLDVYKRQEQLRTISV